MKQPRKPSVENVVWLADERRKRAAREARFTTSAAKGHRFTLDEMLGGEPPFPPTKPAA